MIGYLENPALSRVIPAKAGIQVTFEIHNVKRVFGENGYRLEFTPAVARRIRDERKLTAEAMAQCACERPLLEYGGRYGKKRIFKCDCPGMRLKSCCENYFIFV